MKVVLLAVIMAAIASHSYAGSPKHIQAAIPVKELGVPADPKQSAQFQRWHLQRAASRFLREAESYHHHADKAVEAARAFHAAWAAGGYRHAGPRERDVATRVARMVEEEQVRPLVADRGGVTGR